MHIKSNSKTAVFILLVSTILCNCAGRPPVDDSAYPKIDLAENLFLKNLPESAAEESDLAEDFELFEFKKDPEPSLRVKKIEDSTPTPAPASTRTSSSDELTVVSESSDELESEPLPPEETVADSQDEATSLFRAAESTMQDGRFESAIRLFKEVLTITSAETFSEAAELKIAQCYNALGDHALANLLYEKWLAQHSESLRVPEVLILRASALEHAGRRVKARKMYREVLEQFPAEPEAKAASRRLAELSRGGLDVRP